MALKRFDLLTKLALHSIHLMKETCRYIPEMVNIASAYLASYKNGLSAQFKGDKSDSRRYSLLLKVSFRPIDEEA